MGTAARLVNETLDAALGRRHRDDPVMPGSGGPRGNAHLTAWTGLTLFVLFAAEGVTILAIGSLITWHIAIGALLIPPTLLKTGSTGWRILGYYTHRAPYVSAGPPPTVMRVLGPLVIVTSLGVLATGALLVIVGQDSSRSTALTLADFRFDLVFLHKAVFFVWFPTMTAHVLARLLPALLIVRPDLHAPAGVPGWGGRAAALTASAVAGAVLAVVLVHADASWSGSGWRQDGQAHLTRR